MKNINLKNKKNIECYTNEAIQKDVEDYKTFITNPILTYHNPRMLQRHSTFEKFTRRALFYFLDFCNINNYTGSLKTLIEDHLINYVKYLYQKLESQTTWIYTRFFPNMLRYFYKSEKSDLIELELKKLRRLPIHKKSKQNVISKYLDYPDILKNILLFDEPKEKLIFQLLIFLGWRSRNIRELELENNLFTDGISFYYMFSPVEQKSPLKINGIYQTIEGKIPDNLNIHFKDYINIYNIKNRLFTGSETWLNTYTKNTLQKYNLPRLGPHAFRRIITEMYINATGDIYSAELRLWHRPKIASSTNHYISFNYDTAIQKITDFILSI